MPISASLKAQRAKDKFKRHTATAGQDLKQGIKDAEGDWKAGAEAATEKYAEGVTEAITNDKYGRGIRATPASKFGDSIGAGSIQKYNQNTAKGADKLQATIQRNIEIARATADSGPARGRRGSEDNITRMVNNARALRADRVSREGA